MPTATQAYKQVTSQQRRDELILGNLGLVRHIVGRLTAQLPPGVDTENLESAGTLGLVEAANKLDPARGVKFESFAAWRIRGAVFDELRRNCPLPQRLIERIAQVRQAYQELPAPVAVEALAAAVGLSEEEVTDCLAAMRMTRMVSWDRLEESSDALTPQLRAPDKDAEWEEQKQQLAQAVEQLSERERLVVSLYYQEDLRLKEIGEVLNLSESRVSRVLNAGLYHLGELLRNNA